MTAFSNNFFRRLMSIFLYLFSGLDLAVSAFPQVYNQSSSLPHISLIAGGIAYQGVTPFKVFRSIETHGTPLLVLRLFVHKKSKSLPKLYKSFKDHARVLGILGLGQLGNG